MDTIITLPLLQLPPKNFIFPRLSSTIDFTRLQALSIFSAIKSIATDEDILGYLSNGDQQHETKFTENSTKGMKTCQRLFGGPTNNDRNWLVFGLIPGFESFSENKVISVCRLSGIKDNGSSVSISFQALTRAKVSEFLDQEAIVILQTIDYNTPLLENFDKKSAQRFLHQILDFVEYYGKAHDIGKYGTLERAEWLKRNFLLLSPTANVLYAQLTEKSTTMESIRKFSRTIIELTSLEAQLAHVDVITALFPFTFQQKLAVFNNFEKLQRISKFNQLVEFGNKLFEEFENLNLIVDNWQTMPSKLSKTKIITTHLRSLKFLVDDFNFKDDQKQLIRSKDAPTRRHTRQIKNDTNEDEDEPDKIAEFIKNLDQFNISPDGKKMILKDYNHLKRMTPNNAEYHTLMNYLEILQDFPWNGGNNSEIIDLAKAHQQLDKDHYGLDNVKDRILEYLAILNLHTKLKSENASKAPILLLTGPPGVGKTSLARSVATTLGRKFQRISLGGLKDESEIKGHRRTYVGALPGLIIQLLRKAQTNNPVILLDEIDKVVGGNSTGNKVNGDPASALLEVLDPEQNKTFTDHYIGFPVDLSNVLFLCTSNDHYQLSPPLLDRMELLEIHGYNYFEKIEIVKNFILPRQILRSGLPKDAVQLNDDVIFKICTDYTRESGVRNLERTIGAVCRGKAIEYSKLIGTAEITLTLPNGYHPAITQDQLALYIGVPPHIREELKLEQSLSHRSGVVNGLSYNSDGSGSKLIFEMIALPSQSFHMTMTGRLGEVLRESGTISTSLVRFILNKGRLNKDNEKLLQNLNSQEFHLHVPLGSISKDGPSAGITMTVCLLSLLLDKVVPSNIAMTGEITLRGLILPIGGVMEKLLGAHLTQKITKVLIPRLNRKDIIEAYLRVDKLQTEIVLKQEEEYLSTGVKYIYDAPEKFIFAKYDIHIVYVEELNDVLKLCWDNEYQLTGPLTEQLHL